MNQNDINRAFTEKVAELLGRGYQIYPGTMGGSQGEIAHVDLYRGDEIIRVLLDRTIGRGEKPDGVRLIVGRNTDRIRMNCFDTLGNTIDDAVVKRGSKRMKYDPATRTYNLPRIRGEALTVRAFLHFDLLRLFAPNIERGDEQAIPYVEHFSISPVERSTVREVYERIVADLTEAYGLLRDAQPASGRTPEELYVSQYAAAALLARVCNWGGDHETAELYALEALKGPFAFIREEQIKNLFLGYTARTECIWGLHAPDMYLDVRSRLYPTRLTDELDMVRDNYQTIFRVSSFTSTNNDYRYQSYFTRTKWEHSVVLLTKFYDKYYDEEQIVPSGRIPGPNLVRLPELYYILAESVYDRDPAAALEYLNTVVTARGLHPIEAANIATPASFREELLNEIMKEFWGEGQIFATYKRFNLPMEGVNGKEHPATDDTYLLPLPESEESAGID